MPTSVSIGFLRRPFKFKVLKKSRLKSNLSQLQAGDQCWKRCVSAIDIIEADSPKPLRLMYSRSICVNAYQSLYISRSGFGESASMKHETDGFKFSPNFFKALVTIEHYRNWRQLRRPDAHLLSTQVMKQKMDPSVSFQLGLVP